MYTYFTSNNVSAFNGILFQKVRIVHRSMIRVYIFFTFCLFISIFILDVLTSPDGVHSTKQL